MRCRVCARQKRLHAHAQSRDDAHVTDAPSWILPTSSLFRSVRSARKPLPFRLHNRMYDSLKPVAIIVESSENETVVRLRTCTPTASQLSRPGMRRRETAVAIVCAPLSRIMQREQAHTRLRDTLPLVLPLALLAVLSANQRGPERSTRSARVGRHERSLGRVRLGTQLDPLARLADERDLALDVEGAEDGGVRRKLGREWRDEVLGRRRRRLRAVPFARAVSRRHGLPPAFSLRTRLAARSTRINSHLVRLLRGLVIRPVVPLVAQFALHFALERGIARGGTEFERVAARVGCAGRRVRVRRVEERMVVGLEAVGRERRAEWRAGDGCRCRIAPGGAWARDVRLTDRTEECEGSAKTSTMSSCRRTRGITRTINLDAFVDDGQHPVTPPPFRSFGNHAASSRPSSLQPSQQQSPASLRHADVVRLVTPAVRGGVLVDV